MKYGIRDGCLRLPWERAFAEAGRIGFDGLGRAWLADPAGTAFDIALTEER